MISNINVEQHEFTVCQLYYEYGRPPSDGFAGLVDEELLEVPRDVVVGDGREVEAARVAQQSLWRQARPLQHINAPAQSAVEYTSSYILH